VVAEAPGHGIRRRRAGKRVDLPILLLGRKVIKIIFVHIGQLYYKFPDRLQHESSNFDDGHGGCDWWTRPDAANDPHFKYYLGK